MFCNSGFGHGLEGRERGRDVRDVRELVAAADRGTK